MRKIIAFMSLIFGLLLVLPPPLYSTPIVNKVHVASELPSSFVVNVVAPVNLEIGGVELTQYSNTNTICLNNIQTKEIKVPIISIKPVKNSNYDTRLARENYHKITNGAHKFQATNKHLPTNKIREVTIEPSTLS